MMKGKVKEECRRFILIYGGHPWKKKCHAPLNDPRSAKIIMNKGAHAHYGRGSRKTTRPTYVDNMGIK